MDLNGFYDGTESGYNCINLYLLATVSDNMLVSMHSYRGFVYMN